MGVEQVKAVSALHGQLSGGPFKVLVRMALVSLDRPNEKGQPAGLYFAGWEPLAQALGHDVPDDDGTEGVRARRKKLKDYVSQAIGVLADAGVIERVGDNARSGRRATYHLTLTGPQEAGTTRSLDLGDHETPSLGDHQVPKIQGGRSLELGAPRKDSGRTQDLPQDATTPSPAHAYDYEPQPTAIDDSDAVQVRPRRAATVEPTAAAR